LYRIPLQTPTLAQLKMASNSNASGNNLPNNKASLITEEEADRRIQALNASRDQRDSTPDSTDGLTAKLRALQPINGTPKRAKLTRLSSIMNSTHQIMISTSKSRNQLCHFFNFPAILFHHQHQNNNCNYHAQIQSHQQLQMLDHTKHLHVFKLSLS